MTPQEKRKYPQEMLLMGGCPNCGQEINRKFVEDVIDEIIDLALAEERKKIIEMIDKFEAEPLLMTSSTNMPCICGFENGDIIELDENNRHKTCGKPLPLIVPMKTPAQKLKEFLTKDEDIAHLTSLKELIK